MTIRRHSASRGEHARRSTDGGRDQGGEGIAPRPRPECRPRRTRHSGSAPATAPSRRTNSGSPRSSAAQATGEPFRFPEVTGPRPGAPPQSRLSAREGPHQAELAQHRPEREAGHRAGHAVSRRDWRLVELDETTHRTPPHHEEPPRGPHSPRQWPLWAVRHEDTLTWVEAPNATIAGAFAADRLALLEPTPHRHPRGLRPRRPRRRATSRSRHRDTAPRSALPVKTRLCPVPSDDSSRRPTGPRSAKCLRGGGHFPGIMQRPPTSGRTSAR